MTTDAFEDYDEESQELLRGLKMIDFDELQQRMNHSLFPVADNYKSSEKRSNEHAMSTPFGKKSLFYKELKGDFFTGYVDFIAILRRMGATISDYDEEIDENAIQLDEVVINVKAVSPKIFNYLDFSNTNLAWENYWHYRKNDYSGQAILNKKEGYLDPEKIFLATDGSGIARYTLYIPYSNDANVSLNNPNISYLEENVAIKLKYLGIDGLITLFSFFKESKRAVYLGKIYATIAREIERTILTDPLALSVMYDFPLEILKQFRARTLETIVFYILRDIVNDDKEAVLLKLFKVLSSKDDFNPDRFLNRLLTERINGKSAFIALYDKMNDWGGDNNFSTLIVELTKIWLLSSYPDADNTIYKEYVPAPHVMYDQKRIIGFRNDDFNFTFEENNDILVSESPFSLQVPGLTSYNRYHPFQPMTPVDLREKTNEGLLLAESIPVPAFYLKAFDDKGAWENFEKSVWLIVDIVSTFTGVGNLARLRYLVKASQWVRLKTVFGIIQVVSSTMSIGLALIENSRNEALVNKIRGYLFWVEICTLGADALSTRILSKQASEARTVLATYRTTVRNKKQLDEIDTFGAHLDEVAELDFLENWDNLPVRRKGYLGAETLRRREIRFWMDEVAKISKGKSRLIVLPKGHKKLQGNIAGFNPFDGNIYVQRGLTEYEIFHEFKHFEEYLKLGKNEYVKGMKRISGSLEQDLIRSYKREKYVFDEIMRNKNRFNRAQIDDAQKYINRVIKKCVNAGIDINKI
jgi:hypothetical protein